MISEEYSARVDYAFDISFELLELDTKNPHFNFIILTFHLCSAEESKSCTSMEHHYGG